MTRLGDVRLVWHCGFWDGPLNGLCLHAGRLCWFDAGENGSEPLARRRFSCFPLTASEAACEQERHAAFREHVGVHCDYDEQGRRQVGALRPREQWQRFYQQYPPGSRRRSAGYTRREPAGFFLFRDTQKKG